jgi:peptidoglycan/LPS O-acetylase OafA/YrhL
VATRPGTNPEPARDRFLGADGLRALACLGVFFNHVQGRWAVVPWSRATAVVCKFLTSGSRGVGIFFVLSGFLLSMPFWRAHRRGKPMPDLLTYAVRRLARIAPGYWVCVLVLALIHGLWHTPWDRVSLLLTLTFTNSLLAESHRPWYDTPLWSIGVEMLFYVMLPLLALGMFRLRSTRATRIYLVSVIVLLALGQWLLLRAAPGIEGWVRNPHLFTADPANWAVSHNAPALFTHFLIGVLAADLYLVLAARSSAAGADSRRPQRWCNGYDLVAGGALLLIAWSAADPHWDLPTAEYLNCQWPTLHILVGLALATLPFSRRLGAWLDNRFLRAIAVLSFGIYIWHMPILYGVRALAQHWLAPQYLRGGVYWYWGTLAYAAVSLLLSYAVAAVSYYLVERPVLNRVHHWHRAQPALRLTVPAPVAAAPRAMGAAAEQKNGERVACFPTRDGPAGAQAA